MSHLSSVMETNGPASQVTISEPKGHIASCVVVEQNLSVAWIRAFTALASPGVKALGDAAAFYRSLLPAAKPRAARG